ncbi:hypothetical protein [Geobacter sp.]|uniref:hypothetical protein n=1 Tax=Geobacter sp. TaxID=46610 RepID=UPI001AD5709C|nr:hypothetical protein [Geobacter sp.]CAG0940947.1 hypothetical protein ANRL1_00322 [Anaerolineae bacterium]
MGDIVKGVGSFFGGNAQKNEYKNALESERAYYQKGADALTKNYGESFGLYQPYVELSKLALPEFQNAVLGSGSYLNALDPMATGNQIRGALSDRNAEASAILNQKVTADPSYTYLADLAQRNLNQQLAARGKYFSGRAVAEGTNDLQNKMVQGLWDRNEAAKQTRLSDLNTRYGELASSYADDFSRGMNVDNTRYTRLGDLMNVGSKGVDALASSKQNLGANLSNLWGKLGSNQAAGTRALGDVRYNQWNQTGNNIGEGISKTMNVAGNILSGGEFFNKNQATW